MLNVDMLTVCITTVCHFAECWVLHIAMLKGIMFSVIFTYCYFESYDKCHYDKRCNTACHDTECRLAAFNVTKKPYRNAKIAFK